MKKLWSKLFKKNNQTLTPPKELKKLVDSIERDEKGKWVIPTENAKNLPKDFTAQLDKFKADLNKASDEVAKPTPKKPVAKKPVPKSAVKKDAIKKDIAETPVAKKPTPKKPKAN